MKKLRLISAVSLAFIASIALTSCQKDNITLNNEVGNDVVVEDVLPDEVLTIQIQVSPNVLNILSSGTVVTIHTNIAYSQVEGASVYLNTLPISWWKSDNQGYFVAKFNMDNVKNILNVGTNVVTLSGYKKVVYGGDEFSGSQNLTVVNNTPSGSAKN